MHFLKEYVILSQKTISGMNGLCHKEKQEGSMQTVELTALVEKLKLKNLTPEIDMTSIKITTPDINRPALQMAGYFEHFASERVQIIGYVEYTYLKHLSKEQRVPIY